MFIKFKSSNFIDALQFELTAIAGNPLTAILKDDQGSVCSTWRPYVSGERQNLVFSGLNDLPYGRYTLELSQGEEEMKLQLVKRV